MKRKMCNGTGKEIIQWPTGSRFGSWKGLIDDDLTRFQRRYVMKDGHGFDRVRFDSRIEMLMT